jgi:hypothetical protein
VARAREARPEAGGACLGLLAAAEAEERVNREDLTLLRECASREASRVFVAAREGVRGAARAAFGAHEGDRPTLVMSRCDTPKASPRSCGGWSDAIILAR